MANYINNSGQIRLGWRSPVVVVSNQPTISASLLQSLYGVWNGDTTTNELDKSIFGSWNSDVVISGTQLSASVSNVWQGSSSFPSSNYSNITDSMSNLWKADNNFNDSIGGLTGSSPNSGATPTFVTGKFGQAFSFDGVNDYVKLPTGSLKFTGDFSISMWVKATSWNTPRTLISNADINSVGNKWNGWWLDVGPSGKLSFIQVNNGTYNNSLTSFIALVPGVWSLVTVTRSSTRSTIYINGTNVGSVVNTISIGYSTTNFPCIGVNNYLSGIFQGWFVGSLEEIGIWQKSLTDNEVIGLYENGNGQSYPYSNPTTLVLDSYGTGHGIIKGATFSTGKVGTAFSFDGSSYVDLPIGTLNKTADFSVALWVYPTVNNTTMSLISCRDGVKGWNVEYVSGNLWFWAGSGTNVQLQTGHSISLNTWTHVLITFKAGVSAKSYINGVLTNTVSLVGKPSVYDNYSPYYLPLLGARRYQNPYTVSADQQAFFTGKLDAIGLWDRELTSIEASAIYNSGNGNEYPFSDAFGSSVSDSVGSNHGTLTNGASFTTGKIGNAFTFDGVNDYVALPDNIFNFTGDFSASAWVYLQTLPSTVCGILGNFNFGAFGGWGMYLSGGNLVGAISNSGGRYYLGNTTSVFTAGQWTNVVMVFKKNIGFYIYANGVLAGQSLASVNPNFGVSPNSSTKSYIGLLNYSGDWWWMPNGSRIDGVNVWQRSISQDEITQLYNSGTGAQYPFTGTFSSAGNQLGVDNGTLMNGCYLSDGKIGKAFTFDGVNDYVQLPNDSLNLTGDFTISMWVNFLNLSATYQILLSSYKAGGTYGTGFAIYRSSGGDLQFEFKSFSNLNQYNIRGFIPQVNTWYHLTFVRKSSSYSNIYINGVLQTVGDYYPNDSVKTMNPTYQSGQIVQIGSHNSSLFSSIKIDSLTAYQKELTQSEITELYNSGNGKQITATPIVQSGLVLNLDASRSSSYTGTGTTWTDISGNSNNGTLVNGPIFGTANGGVINFDGVNDYVDLGTKSSLAPGTTDFTISFWVNPSSWSTTYSPFFTTTNTNGLWIGKSGSNFILRSYNVADDVQYSVLPTLNTWTMITINKSGGVARIYYNDVMVASANNSKNYVTGNSYIGSDGPQLSWASYINCKLSTFLYYNRGLSELEITQNFNSTKGRFGL